MTAKHPSKLYLSRFLTLYPAEPDRLRILYPPRINHKLPKGSILLFAGSYFLTTSDLHQTDLTISIFPPASRIPDIFNWRWGDHNQFKSIIYRLDTVAINWDV